MTTKIIILIDMKPNSKILESVLCEAIINSIIMSDSVLKNAEINYSITYGKLGEV
jgi:hypothetical protein